MRRQQALAKMQAKFRGNRERQVHIKRARAGIPVCPFLRTPARAIDAMLEVSGITHGDLVYDLGCGDGAISLEVARQLGARCVGFDIDTSGRCNMYSVGAPSFNPQTLPGEPVKKPSDLVLSTSGRCKKNGSKCYLVKRERKARDATR